VIHAPLCRPTPVQAPFFPGIGDEKNYEQKQQGQVVEFCAEVAPHRNSQTGLPRWVNSEPKTLYSPKSRKKADVKMRATAMASELEHQASKVRA
jgi:hypothetical protein